MSVNVIGEYRKHYLKERISGADPAEAHKEALENIYLQLINYSASCSMPVQDRAVQLIKDLKNNPHFQQLLEDVLDMSMDDQKEYLRSIARVPNLRLVK